MMHRHTGPSHQAGPVMRAAMLGLPMPLQRNESRRWSRSIVRRRGTRGTTRPMAGQHQLAHVRCRQLAAYNSRVTAAAGYGRRAISE